MRYSFHGKVRATGQQVDGFVEAANATLAIDRLADKGIIGVYSVRPEPKPAKQGVLTAEEAAKQAKDAEDARAGKEDRRAARALPAPQPPADVATAELLKQLVEKITILTGKVEAVLARPQSVVYQAGSGGPARNAAGGKKPRAGGDVQNSTLRDIFQNNLDLRQSLEKLATTVGPALVRPVESTPRELPAPKREVATTPREPSNKNRELVTEAQPAA